MLYKPLVATATRNANPTALAEALTDARHRTLATFGAYASALASTQLVVPYSSQLNPPLWELGHVGWFQEWWLRRNPERQRGAAADPEAPRLAPRRADADALFDSSRVPHASRWHLQLPSAGALCDELAAGLQESLELLSNSGASDDDLYFFRLCLFHEDMHQEAAVYMAQCLGIALEDWAPLHHAPGHDIAIGACQHMMGAPAEGFVFDNELGRHPVTLSDFQIDSAPITWERFLRFVEAGCYQQRDWWDEPGWTWLQAQGLQAPRYLRRLGDSWQRETFGRWLDIDPTLPAMNVSCFEAQAYCAWAGRRLPTEMEWECAAEVADGEFGWGQVWEWTASAFVQYPGFVAHPYRDYSAPWFNTRQVLRGGSFATHPRMKHPRYRNFFLPERNDIHAGFRTCALT